MTKFTFSLTRTISRTILELAAVPSALLNVEYLKADPDLSVEDLFLGLRVLCHLDVDRTTLFEERHKLLDNNDCSSVNKTNQNKIIDPGFRLMISSIN